ncbi:hypothetical protein AgCh_009206 [Apium graveolens]
MTDGRVYHIRQNTIPLKYYEELEHVLFLLQVKNRLTDDAANNLKTQIQRQKKLYSVKSDSTYCPKLDQDIRKARINDLRAAIFQIGEDTVELKNAKRRMVNELEYAERCLLKNYLRTTPDIKEINELKLRVLVFDIDHPEPEFRKAASLNAHKETPCVFSAGNLAFTRLDPWSECATVVKDRLVRRSPLFHLDDDPSGLLKNNCLKPGNEQMRWSGVGLDDSWSRASQVLLVRQKTRTQTLFKPNPCSNQKGTALVVRPTVKYKALRRCAVPRYAYYDATDWSDSCASAPDSEIETETMAEDEAQNENLVIAGVEENNYSTLNPTSVKEYPKNLPTLTSCIEYPKNLPTQKSSHPKARPKPKPKVKPTPKQKS